MEENMMAASLRCPAFSAGPEGLKPFATEREQQIVVHVDTALRIWFPLRHPVEENHDADAFRFGGKVRNRPDFAAVAGRICPVSLAIQTQFAFTRSSRI